MKIINGSIPRSILVYITSALIFTSAALAQNINQTTSPNNLKIFVQYKLVKDNLLTKNNIQVEVSGDKIILTGTVPSLYDKSLAGEEAHSVDEKYTIVNNLGIEDANIPDSVLTNTIFNKIQSNLFYTIFDWLQVNSNNGFVTMEGWVHLPWLKDQFQTEVEKIPGVKGVDNKLQNTFGPGDFGIRIARIIYNNPRFMGLQYVKNPPIHIIVNNGNVILEGYVSSEIEKSVAENLVRYRTDVFSVENNLQIKS